MSPFHLAKTKILQKTQMILLLLMDRQPVTTEKMGLITRVGDVTEEVLIKSLSLSPIREKMVTKPLAVQEIQALQLAIR